MPTESEFRDHLKATEAPAVQLDARAIIRRSRARRLPAQIAVGGAFSLAVLGIGVAGVSGVFSPPVGGSQEAMAPVEDSDLATPESLTEESTQTEIFRDDASVLNQCGATLVGAVPNPAGLELIVNLPEEADLADGELTGTVTLVNNGTEPVSGTTAALPVLTASQDGVVVWHSHGAMIMLAVIVDLEPGQSMEYGITFTPVLCEAEDDLDDPASLPPLDPGTYELSAAIDLVSAEVSDGGTTLVTGPTSTIRLQ
jgi:hypothetical protein